MSVNGQVDEKKKKEEEEEEEQETEERREKRGRGRVRNSRPIRFLRRGNRSQRRLLGYTVGAAKRS